MKHTYTETQQEKICQLVYDWMKEHDCFSGEHTAQCDTCTIDAIDL